MSDDLFDMLMDGAHFENVRETVLKAPFSWAGSKARSLEQILPHIPYGDTFVDVCGGTGVILLNRRPSKLDVFNDAFSGITDFYRCIKDDKLLKQMMDWLELTPYGREFFQICKSEWKNTGDPAERAAKWYYSLMASFGSLGRNFGRATGSNVNIASKIRNKFELFWPVHERLKSVQIENQDCEHILKDYDGPKTVFYIDPPYLYSDSGIYDEAWNHEKHKRLLQCIFNCEGTVVLSGYANDLYDSMPWSERLTWKTRITLAAKAHTETNNLADKANVMSKEADECLWIKD